MASFEILGEPEHASGLLAHVPHSSDFVPDTERPGFLLGDLDLKGEGLRVTDHFTDLLYSGALESGGLMFVNRLSRLVVDPERFRDDADEVMAPMGAGAVYLRATDGAELRRDSPVERERLLQTYFDPYARAMEQAVDRLLARFGRCLVLDCHSFPRTPLRWEIHREAPRPELCLGTDSFHTPASLVAAMETACERQGVGFLRDVPFSGCYVPLKHYRRDASVAAVMIEVRRDLYMNEETGELGPGFEETKGTVGALIEAALNWLVSTETKTLP